MSHLLPVRLWLFYMVRIWRITGGFTTSFSSGSSGCTGIFPDSTVRTITEIWANWVSIILLMLTWFLKVEAIASTLAFIFSKILSLAASFLFKDSFILPWPKTSLSRKVDFENYLSLCCYLLDNKGGIDSTLGLLVDDSHGNCWCSMHHHGPQGSYSLSLQYHHRPQKSCESLRLLWPACRFPSRYACHDYEVENAAYSNLGWSPPCQ